MIITDRTKPGRTNGQGEATALPVRFPTLLATLLRTTHDFSYIARSDVRAAAVLLAGP